ncbi:MAG: response regulator transcription factor [Oscillospiraceae bacterium]|nr:response regulator transcription factor [Oscillospiraceae bacterium]
MRILVVDDEKPLVKGIKFNLESEGYDVDVCYDGQTALDMARATKYDVILLDIMMPRISGLDVCMKIREFSKVPVIMLTAKSEDTDKLLGFEYGADDYMTKPFNILELKARVRALVRRSAMTGGADEAKERITRGHITLDSSRRSAEKDGVYVDLTAKEFNLAELLMRNPGKVYARERLLDIIWGLDYQGDVRTVDVHIRRLREKLEHNPAVPVYFNTKWGVGYYFSED